ncbi:MAG: transcriptional repressor [Chlorobi bacterium]|nr:MAG: transcriptional repressor [Bacteroidota bacterium]KXK35045.1 MAG: Fe(2+) uptake regulation protein [Chlorobi bacterium OLB6]MBE2265602.1 transcriptional repressor [Flavobacteriales bacterium]MBL1161699.1 transcriptional repressor [Chlorobiota bacterium]MBW7853940.1 transcriptional repressor [Candidatus Kapabacteria bacterium]MCC6331817.1 transcriptional repressor [Ignavibacteria bacterium]
MSANVKLEQLQNQFAEFLRRKKYRATQERYRILETIAELDRHFSADELYFEINNRGERVSRATVYSTLDLLTQCGILTKHRFQGESAHFELSSRMPNHDHLICTECGRVVEFRNEAIDAIRNSVAESLGFVPVSHSLQIFAVCHNPSTCEFNIS